MNARSNASTSSKRVSTIGQQVGDVLGELGRRGAELPVPQRLDDSPDALAQRLRRPLAGVVPPDGAQLLKDEASQPLASPVPVARRDRFPHPFELPQVGTQRAAVGVRERLVLLHEGQRAPAERAACPSASAA